MRAALRSAAEELSTSCGGLEGPLCLSPSTASNAAAIGRDPLHPAATATADAQEDEAPSSEEPGTSGSQAGPSSDHPANGTGLKLSEAEQHDLFNDDDDSEDDIGDEELDALEADMHEKAVVS